MDSYLLGKIREATPSMNPLLCNGIVTEQMRGVEGYIDQVMRCAAELFPPGLEYIRSQRCTPEEDYAEATRNRFTGNSRATFELAQSDLFMVKYIFKWEGELLPPKYYYLPYVREGGLMQLRGTKYAINPVIADILFSVDASSVYIALTRDKLTFKRATHYYHTTDGRETTSVVYGSIYHGAKSKTSAITVDGARVDAKSTLTHYLFAKYGLFETFKLYCNTDIVVGEEEITAKEYPPEDWVICSSTGLMPSGVRGRDYSPTRLRLAIKRNDYTHSAKALIGGFFYVCDHYPTRTTPEYITYTRLWRTLLGHILMAKSPNEGKWVEDIENHLDSLDTYVDGMVLKNLRERNIECTNIYDLFMYIMNNISNMIVQNDVTNLYGKRLTTLHYILFDVVCSIFNMAYQIKKIQNKAITKRDILKFITAPKDLEVIESKLDQHGEIANISYPGDNLFIKVANKIVLQSEATTKGDKNRNALEDPAKFLHASLSEVCSYLYQPKFSPTGHNSINPYLDIGVDGLIRPSEKWSEILGDVQHKIARQ